MPMILPVFAILITLMIGTMSGSIINISVDTILHHPDKINIAEAGASIMLFLCNIACIATLMGHATSEINEIPSTAKCIGNRLPLKQTLYILGLTIIAIFIMADTAATLTPNNTNTIPLVIMFGELWCIFISPAAQQIANFMEKTKNIHRNQTNA